VSFSGAFYIKKNRLKCISNDPDTCSEYQDWRKLNEYIEMDNITGEQAFQVSNLLRKYDPVAVSKYRIALILDIIKNSPRKSSISSIIDLHVQIPGWQVLGMSYLEEAFLLGYVTINNSFAELSDKGNEELIKLKLNGYDKDHWLFVEKRLHESLVVSCPFCQAENVSNWYWPSFNCSGCRRDVPLERCTEIDCRCTGIALNNHRIA
jgi:hypothetical protein